MVLLPLIDDALRNGLEPLPLGGAIVLRADVAGRQVRVCIVDDGLPRVEAADDASVTATLRERLYGLYGDAASLELTTNLPQGTVATIEVPG
jgi:LytS/YehU family sensor histidine kinase